MRSRIWWGCVSILLFAAAAIALHSVSTQTADASLRRLLKLRQIDTEPKPVAATDKGRNGGADYCCEPELAGVPREQYGVLDTAGHVSVRLPSNPNHFYLARWIAPAWLDYR